MNAFRKNTTDEGDKKKRFYYGELRKQYCLFLNEEFGSPIQRVYGSYSFGILRIAYIMR